MKQDRYSTLADDYAAGHTIQELAEKYGVSYRAVWQAMEKRGIKRRSKARRNQTGSNNPNWLGDKASYFGMHKRVRKVRGKPQHCEHCGRNDAKTKYHWANLTRKYEDPYDYIRLCVSCHAKHDNWAANVNG